MDKIDPKKAKIINEKDLPKEIPKKVSREELRKRIRNKRNVMKIKRKSKYAKKAMIQDVKDKVGDIDLESFKNLNLSKDALNKLIKQLGKQ